MKFTTTVLTILLITYMALSQNNAISFDGINEHITTSYSGVSGNADRTIEAWIKVPSSIATTQYVITDYGNFNLPNGQRFTLNILNRKLRIEVRGWGLNGDTELNDDMWHHVAVTYRGNGDNQFILYVDGIVEAVSNTPTVTINTSNLNDFQIGERLDNGKYFVGEMDEVRFWDDVRSGTEIASFKDTELNGNEANLVAYYNFNTATLGVDSVPDLSPGNNPGTMVNFDNGDVIPSTVPITTIPIELSTFYGYIQDQQAVKLEWTTQSEIDNAVFEIERFYSGGQLWEKIGQIEGSGTTNEGQSYTLTDASPFEGVNYYRLRQFDFSGSYSLSDIIQVKFTNKKTTPTLIYPNPTRNTINLESTTPLNIVKVFSLYGSLIYHSNLINEKYWTLDLSEHPDGHYIIFTGDKVFTIEKSNP